MKIPSLALSAILLSVLTPTLSFSASTSFDDGYWGGTYWGPNTADVLGGSKYEVDRAMIDHTADTLTVTVYGNYFNFIGEADTTVGDLFISNNGWNPAGTASQFYDTDFFESSGSKNGEGWEYVLVIDQDRYDRDASGDPIDAKSLSDLGTSGTVSLYEVGLNNENRIQTSNNQPLVPTPHHAHQEVLFDASGLNALTTGTWSIFQDGTGGSDDYIQFMIDYAGFGFNSFSDIGIHWTMTCANDVIEGSPVPEPATIALFGIGIAGLAGRRIRRSR